MFVGKLTVNKWITVEKVCTNIFKVAAIIGMISVCIMMVLTVIDVFLRYLFNSPLRGVVELTEFMMVVVVFLSLAYCLMEGEHIRLNFFINKLPAKGKAVLNAFCCIIALVIYVLITWQNYLEVLDIISRNKISDILHIPVYPFEAILVIGCALTCIAFLIVFIRSIAQVVQR
jgi:TRAP-type C4-dicarboxylate transport system permease small subunit